MGDSGQLSFGKNIRRIRESLGQTQEGLAAESGFDRSYIGGIERGERNPSLSAILRLASALRVPPARLFSEIGEVSHVVSDIPAGVRAIETADGLDIRFRYDRHDARYSLRGGATLQQYNAVLNVLRDGLMRGRGRSNAVRDMFLSAVRTWPDANPSDLWTFLVNRTYCDRENHPASNSRLNLEQSWKRTSGWALERVLVEQYGQFLKRHGILLEIATKAKKTALLGGIGDTRIIPDKADVLLTYDSDGEETLLGVVHVKASIAERRTDDVPMSQALIEAGYVSVFWTMDTKSFPSSDPVNRGEFGEASGDSLSDKRRDFEERGHFSACFSYNRNTLPTPSDRDVSGQIYVCDFTDPADSFARYLVGALSHHLQQRRRR